MMNYRQYGGRRRKLFFIPFIIALCFLLSAVVQFLWNAVLPDVAHLGKLTYWQAAALLLLSRILFGSFHFGRRGGPPNHMKEKWAGMKEENREKFRDEFRRRRGHHER